MSDFERTFGAGADVLSIIDGYSRSESQKMMSIKQKIFEREKKKFNRVLIQLGFKWCLKYHVIDFPKLSPKAVFLDRTDNNIISRLIIDPRPMQIEIRLTNTKQFENTIYTVSRKHAFHNAVLIAMDFKFSSQFPYINTDSLIDDYEYVPMKIV